MQNNTFQEAVCAHWQCPSSEYSDRVLACCYVSHARPFLGLIKRFCPGTLALDYYLIELVGRTRDADELDTELDRFHYDYPSEGLLRMVLDCRVSGRLLLRLGSTVWRKEPLPNAEIRKRGMGWDDRQNDSHSNRC
jgi:hypothetical protein